MEERIMNRALDRERKAERRKRYIGRGISWVLMAVLVLIIVPIAAVMFFVSGLSSAVDRVLLKFNR